MWCPVHLCAHQLEGNLKALADSRRRCCDVCFFQSSKHAETVAGVQNIWWRCAIVLRGNSTVGCQRNGHLPLSSWKGCGFWREACTSNAAFSNSKLCWQLGHASRTHRTSFVGQCVATAIFLFTIQTSETLLWYDIYIIIYIHNLTIIIIIIRIKVILVTIMHCITFINYTLHCVMLHYIKFPHSITSLLIWLIWLIT